MNRSFLLRASTTLAFCLLLSLPTFAQTGGFSFGKIGPSKGEVVGIIVGVAVAITVSGVLIYHETHKHPSITGCVATGADGLTLQNEKDNKVYALSGNSAALGVGERDTLKGNKVKNSNGRASFQVDKLTKDYGKCNP
jgi:hypothetical protein